MILILALLFNLNFSANLPTIKDNGHNTVYIGVENKINIAINNTNPEDITIKITTGNIYRRDDSTFAFNPTFEVEEFKIKLYYKKVLCEVKNMTVKRMAEPTLYFDGEVDGKLSVGNVSTASSLKFIYDNSIPDDIKNKLFSYNLLVKPHNKPNPTSFSIRSNNLNEIAVNFIKTQEEGTTIMISDVLAISPSGIHTRVNATKRLTLTK